MFRWSRLVCGLIGVLVASGFLPVGARAQQPAPPTTPANGSVDLDFVTEFCADCHNAGEKSGGIDLVAVRSLAVNQRPEVWEKVIQKLRSRQMPPLDAPRPTESIYNAIVLTLGDTLDREAAEHPNPGRTDTFRRLNRTEYQNAIRDLFGLEVDATALLPTDEPSHGFDNVTVADLSPTLLDRYVSAAQRISRLAVGRSSRTPGGDTFRIKADTTQEEHVEGLPLGTRGGTLIPYTFPQDGDYEIQIRLARDRNEEIEGLTEPHDLEVLVDRDRVRSIKVEPPAKSRDFASIDEKLKFRISVTAGSHQLGVTFVKKPSSLLETKRQPYQAHFNMHRHPRLSPAIYQVSITGPYGSSSSQGTRARGPIFLCEPKEPSDEEACARTILSTLIRRAYRRPVTDADMEKPLEFYREARTTGDYDAGIEMALSAVLVNPQFLFRMEQDPPNIEPQTAYRISDLELASRLSFFLWSSIPDDELLDVAIAGNLHQPDVLERQVRRMLADARSGSLATNFAGQWLHLRKLESITPDLRLFPDFDDNLRQAMRRETELLFESVLRDDHSVLKLLKCDYMFLNERLAKHYGIPHVYGSRFRRVSSGDDHARGGLFRQGSILTATSYATRTSPVIRGKWILDNILGTPPPPQPPNVPALKENTISLQLPVRERLAEHRANAACARCHNLMDPVGFSLENFDAVGRWRDREDGNAIDATGSLSDGNAFTGVGGLERALLDRPEVFVGTMTEKLLTFALGRGMEFYDAPAIRKIVRDAKQNNYRFSSLMVGIATSTPFQMRRSP